MSGMYKLLLRVLELGKASRKIGRRESMGRNEGWSQHQKHKKGTRS